MAANGLEGSLESEISNSAHKAFKFNDNCAIDILHRMYGEKMKVRLNLEWFHRALPGLSVKLAQGGHRQYCENCTPFDFSKITLKC